MNRWLKRSIIGLTATTGLAFGLVGFAHTSAGKPLLAYLSGAPGCPVDQAASPAAIEEYRSRTLQAGLKGAAADAKATPALGFSLGQSNRADVERFAAAQGAKCEESSQGAALRCVGFKAGTSLEPAIADLYAQFDPSGRLVAVDVFRDVTPGDGPNYLKAKLSGLAQAVGPITKRIGTPLDGPSADVTAALQQPFARSAVRFEYRDYRAELSVMNFGKGRHRAREQYQWLPRTELAAR